MAGVVIGHIDDDFKGTVTLAGLLGSSRGYFVRQYYFLPSFKLILWVYVVFFFFFLQQPHQNDACFFSRVRLAWSFESLSMTLNPN